MEDTFALTYHDKPSDAWWFIPTVPEARNKWRGPFARIRDLDDAINAELGADCTIIRTIVRPSHLA